MFYSQLILSRKGPLAKAWIAAHWDRKLSKASIVQVDIEQSVDHIVHPDEPLALRLTGHLLLGLARIYQRKVRYLYIDCNEALVKIKLAFRAADVDLPAGQAVGSGGAINLPQGQMDALQPSDDFGGDFDLSFSVGGLDDFASGWTMVGSDAASQRGPAVPAVERTPTTRDPLRIPDEDDGYGLPPMLDSDIFEAPEQPRDSLEPEVRRDRDLSFGSGLATPRRGEGDLSALADRPSLGGRVSFGDQGSDAGYDMVTGGFDDADFGMAPGDIAVGDEGQEQEEREQRLAAGSQEAGGLQLITASDVEAQTPSDVDASPASAAVPAAKRPRKRGRVVQDESTILSNDAIKDALRNASATLLPVRLGLDRLRDVRRLAGEDASGWTATLARGGDATGSAMASHLLQPHFVTRTPQTGLARPLLHTFVAHSGVDLPYARLSADEVSDAATGERQAKRRRVGAAGGEESGPQPLGDDDMVPGLMDFDYDQHVPGMDENEFEVFGQDQAPAPSTPTPLPAPAPSDTSDARSEASWDGDRSSITSGMRGASGSWTVGASLLDQLLLRGRSRLGHAGRHSTAGSVSDASSVGGESEKKQDGEEGEEEDDELDARGRPLLGHAKVPVHKWHRRTRAMLSAIQTKFHERQQRSEADGEPEGEAEDDGEAEAAETQSVSFGGLAEGASRRAAAVAFSELLVLKSWSIVNVKQREPFDDIRIDSTDSFHDALRQNAEVASD